MSEHVENEKNETFVNDDNEEDDLFAEDAKSDEIPENQVEKEWFTDFEESIEIVKNEVLSEDDDICDPSSVQGTRTQCGKNQKFFH